MKFENVIICMKVILIIFFMILWFKKKTNEYIVKIWLLLKNNVFALYL